MNAQAIKSILTDNDIFDFLQNLGGSPIDQGDAIISRTVCHGGNTHKLFYYKESKVFRCYTDCGTSFDIFGLVQKMFNLEFIEALKYICKKFGIDDTYHDLDLERVDVSFINKFRRKKEEIKLRVLEKEILNDFYNLGHESWIDNGISVDTMSLFEIKYSLRDNKIIIPHFDINNSLIGIRGRALEKRDIDAGRKYMPIKHNGVLLNNPTGANIYGLHVTKPNIEKAKTIVLVESEKAVMQLCTFGEELNIGGAISGSSLTDYQVELLRRLDINNVVIAMDKEFREIGSPEEVYFQNKIRTTMVDKLTPYFNVRVIWDRDNLIGYKDSPTDHGKDIFMNLLSQSIRISG